MLSSVTLNTIERLHSVIHNTYLVYHTLGILFPSDLSTISISLSHE